MIEAISDFDIVQDDLDDVCPICVCSMEWEECYNNCDDGYFDCYDDDPLWYDEDDVEVCDACRGKGGWWVCPEAYRHEVSS